MINVKNMSCNELEIYCDLLPIAYKIYQNKTGFVCGAKAEQLRDELYKSSLQIMRDMIIRN